MKSKLPVIGIVLGGLFMTGPFWGVLGTVLGMMKAFDKLADAGPGDPSHLSGAIGEVLVSTAVGVVFFGIGVVLVIASCIVLMRRRNAAPSIPLPSTNS